MYTRATKRDGKCMVTFFFFASVKRRRGRRQGDDDEGVFLFSVVYGDGGDADFSF